MVPCARDARRQECASGVRDAFDPIVQMAMSGSDGRQLRRRVKIVGFGLAERDEDVVAAVAGRGSYELRFLGELATARESIAAEKPDVLILDEGDGADDVVYALLDWLANELRSPVVVILSSRSSRPALAEMFGVPSLRKPVNADSLAAAIAVGLDKQLSPVRRSGTAGG